MRWNTLVDPVAIRAEKFLPWRAKWKYSAPLGPADLAET